MQTLASSVRGVVDEMRQIHTNYRSPVEEKGQHGHSQGESTTTLAWTGFYWLSNSMHQRRFSFIMLRFALGNYFLQIAKERMLLITSYRLTKKKTLQMQGNDNSNWSGYTLSLGELAQTSGSYFKDMQ